MKHYLNCLNWTLYALALASKITSAKHTVGNTILSKSSFPLSLISSSPRSYEIALSRATLLLSILADQTPRVSTQYHVTKLNPTKTRTFKPQLASLFRLFAISRCALVTALYHQPIYKTTVSRLFSDRAGAVPQSTTTEDPVFRPSFLQRLQIRTSSSRKHSPASSESRPGSSSSRPSHSPARPSTSKLHDVPVITPEVTMPHTLEVETTPPPASKRQRSADGSDNYTTPGPASSTRSASRAQSPALPVKIPAFLNKSRGGKQPTLSQEVPSARRSGVPNVSNGADKPM